MSFRNLAAFIVALIALATVTGAYAQRLGGGNVGIHTHGGNTSGGGTLRVPDGSAAAPSYSFANDTDTGFFSGAANNIDASIAGQVRFRFAPDFLNFTNSAGLRWFSDVSGFGTTVTTLIPEAANTLAQRNGASAQVYRLYNTQISTTNKEHLSLGWTGNDAFITTVKGSVGGSDRHLNINGGTGITFRTGGSVDDAINGGSSIWVFNSAGHFLAIADNTYDIGASGATRPRNLYVASAGTFGTSLSSASLTVSGMTYLGITTVAGLPTCDTPIKGARAMVTDSNAAYSFGGTIVAGGTTIVPVFCAPGVGWLQG